MAALLAERIGAPVRAASLADDVRGVLTTLARPVRVATYLLTDGQFVESLRAAADGLGQVAEPLGAHPALSRLVWQRYDELAGDSTG
jgi:sirohydrochlorin ferrochelatase